MTRDGGNQSLADLATEKIRDRILDLSLQPGMQLDENILRDRLAISRTPAREALNRLVAEGLVENRSNKGFYVTSLDVHQTARFFEAFFIVELASANLCRFAQPGFADDMDEIQRRHRAAVDANEFLQISRYNAEFHIRIVHATENEHLFYFARRVHNYARRLVYFVYATECGDPGYFADQQGRVKDEHQEIIEAIRGHDRPALVDVMTRHADRFQDRMLRYMGGRWPTAANAMSIVLPRLADG